MKKKIFLLASSCLLSLSFQANATDIAVVNLEEVINNSTAMTKAKKVLEKRKSDVEKKLKSEEESLNKEKQSLESSVKTLAKDVAQEKVVAFQNKVLKFQSKVKDEEVNLQKAYSDVVVEITNNIKDIINDIKGKGDKKFDVALPTAATLFYNENIDISSDVLSVLNKKLKEAKTLKK